MLVDHVGIDMGVGYNIGYMFVLPWQTSTKIAPSLWATDLGYKLVTMHKLQMLAFWEIKRFVRSLMWTTIMLGPASNPPYFHIAVDCHKGYMLILRPGNETYAKPVWVGRVLSKSKFATSSLIFNRFRWSITDRQHGVKMWFGITQAGK